jgi:hypothetical protein
MRPKVLFAQVVMSARSKRAFVATTQMTPFASRFARRLSVSRHSSSLLLAWLHALRRDPPLGAILLSSKIAGASICISHICMQVAIRHVECLSVGGSRIRRGQCSPSNAHVRVGSDRAVGLRGIRSRRDRRYGDRFHARVAADPAAGSATGACRAVGPTSSDDAGLLPRALRRRVVLGFDIGDRLALWGGLADRIARPGHEIRVRRIFGVALSC